MGHCTHERKYGTWTLSDFDPKSVELLVTLKRRLRLKIVPIIYGCIASIPRLQIARSQCGLYFQHAWHIQNKTILWPNSFYVMAETVLTDTVFSPLTMLCLHCMHAFSRLRSSHPFIITKELFWQSLFVLYCRTRDRFLLAVGIIFQG